MELRPIFYPGKLPLHLGIIPEYPMEEKFAACGEMRLRNDGTEKSQHFLLFMTWTDCMCAHGGLSRYIPRFDLSMQRE